MRCIQRFLHIKYRLLGAFQHSVQATDDRHRQNDIAILPAHINVAQAVVRDAPDKADNRVIRLIIHTSDISLTIYIFKSIIHK